MFEILKRLVGGSAAPDPSNEAAEDMSRKLSALNRSQAIIEFTPDGTILTANDNFLAAMGYTLAEVKGNHHSMFVEPEYRNSNEYRQFWAKLGRGEFHASQYPRIAKGGREVWIQASYNPVSGPNGEIISVIKFATDITEVKTQEFDWSGQLVAIGKSQAVIEFTPDGTILTANENFLSTVGYSLSDIRGKHHSMFVDANFRETAEYRQFWAKLGRGEYDAGQYPRYGHGGKLVWLQASYNPILDGKGRVMKVVKYCSDITAQKLAAQELEKVTAETSDVIGAIARGDLSKTMQGQYSPSIDGLKSAVNSCVENLQNMVTQITDAASSIATSSGEIAQGNQDLSQRTEEQASSLEQTASSMEELTSTVKQNSENARQANQLARAAREQAEAGGAVVGTAISAMAEINRASNKIADIIGVIDEIAFQTNLLALNAAVEAARAGDQGRGFAVVASEVRNLAQRSAGAAKEIKTLIKDSVFKVEEGSRLVNNSGATLEEIVGAVKKVSDIISEIAAASEEQSAGIEQVNKAITHMDQAVQQNAALVEEAAAASESMDEQSRNLARLMEFFRGGEASGSVSHVPERRSASRPWTAPAISKNKGKTLSAPAGAKSVQARAATGSARPSSQEWEDF